MKWFFYTILFFVFCGNSFSQNCTINITSNQVFINNQLITFTSLGEFKKLLGDPDSINYGIAFFNRQLEVLKVYDRSGKHPTGEYGINVRFDQQNNHDLNTSRRHPPLNHFNGTLIFCGDTISGKSKFNKANKLKGWKLEERPKTGEWSSFVLYNKSLEVLVEFRNDLLISFSLVPAKDYAQEF